MDQLIATLENSHISKAPLRLDLDEKFLQKFKNIFQFKGKDIKVTGTADNPWFKAKDVLEILGYSDSSAKTSLQRVNEIFKATYTDLTEHAACSNSHPSYHEGKEIYVNEAGLYYLIMRSKLKSAEDFQMFVYTELLPGIRKIIQKRYEDALAQKQDQLEIVISQNALALQKLQEMGIVLEETKNQNDEMNEKLDEIQDELQETNSKLDRALPDRGVDPDDDKLKHHFILFKSKDDETQYVFVRGQDRYINNKKTKFATEFDITLDKTKTPNPIDLLNRLKDRVQLINETAYTPHLEALKESAEYVNASATCKRAMILNCKRQFSRLIYRSNKITLLNFTEDELLNMMRRLDSEKYDV